MAYQKAPNAYPLKGGEKSLTHKQQMFVHCYLATMNASQAVLDAGYKTKNPNRIGTDLLRHPVVRRILDEEMAKRREKMEFSADFLLTKLMKIINDSETKTSDTLRAIELAGKSIALWKERQEISGPDGGAIEMEQRLKEDVADFTSKLSRLAESAGAGTVAKLPKPRG